MKWNIDFEVSAMLFQLIFIVFFIIKKHLPTKQTKFFFLAMMVSFFTTILDLVTAVMNSYADRFPDSILFTVNTIYFCMVPVLSLVFFSYILALTKQLEFVKTPLFFVYCIPFLISEIMAVLSPFTGFLYSFENKEYVHGSFYLLEFVFNVFYLLLTFVYITIYQKNVTKLQRQCIYFFCFLLFGSAIAQARIFSWILLTNAVTSTALVIVYLSLQSPDFYIDKSTDMFNIDAFSEIASEILLDKGDFNCQLLFIDDYRTIKSLYGVENISDALLEFAEYIKNTVRNIYVFHLGNGNFLFLSPTDYDFGILEGKIRKRVALSFSGENEEVHFTVSTVYIKNCGRAQSVKRILDIMDFSAQEAITQGKETMFIVNDKIIDQMEHDSAVDRALERAIAENTIQMYYQPIYSTEDRKITSCEALARLFDDEIGFISPDEFIQKAEKNGSIIKLGNQIFEKVCIFMRDSSLNQYGLEHVEINLSPIQCMQENLTIELMQKVMEYGINPERINLEITETATADNMQVVRKNMERLIAKKITFSLDDYGTGYSNMVSIMQLPFQYIKLDKTLVWAYFAKKSTILPEVTRMILSQNLKIIVEGVETEEMVNTLSDMGCQYLQGFFYSKPLPERDFISFVKNFNF